jgi:hypothetical protein
MRILFLLTIIVGLFSCSRTEQRDTITELEDRLLADQKVSEAPIKDTFLEEENYVGPLNDQLNPFEKEEKVESLFDKKDLVHDKTDYKQEFGSIEKITENENTFETIREGDYKSKGVGPYEEILTVEKLALDDDREESDPNGIPENGLEHDWQTGKNELSKVLDVAPLTEEELREFLSKGRVKRKPQLPLRNKDLLKAAYNGPLESIRYLLKKGLDINTTNRRGDTPLIIAVKRNRYEVAHYLLKFGADENIKNKKGENASRLARKSKDPRFKSLFP